MIEIRCLKSVVVFIQTVLSFVLLRKITNCLSKILGNTCDGVRFWYLSTKTLTLSMVFFKYLAKILQDSNLNGCFHEESEKQSNKCIIIDLCGFLQ